MANIQMEVIPEPAQGTASVLIPGPNGPQVMFKGNESDNYVCGTCRKIIYQNIKRGMFINLVFKCFNCKSYNRVRGT